MADRYNNHGVSRLLLGVRLPIPPLPHINLSKDRRRSRTGYTLITQCVLPTLLLQRPLSVILGTPFHSGRYHVRHARRPKEDAEQGGLQLPAAAPAAFLLTKNVTLRLALRLRVHFLYLLVKATGGNRTHDLRLDKICNSLPCRLSAN